jgi:hypothetical protein
MVKSSIVFQISNNLTEQEALEFAYKLQNGEHYYLVKVFENPKERHFAKRKKFVVVRQPRQGEVVTGAYRKVVKGNQLLRIR